MVAKLFEQSSESKTCLASKLTENEGRHRIDNNLKEPDQIEFTGSGTSSYAGRVALNLDEEINKERARI